MGTVIALVGIVLLVFAAKLQATSRPSATMGP